MNKKIISLVLALVMVLGTFTSVFAAETTKKDEAKKPEASEKVEKIVGKDNKIQYIIDKKLVEGYEDGSYGLDKNIKRSEITRLLVLANGNEDIAKKLQGAMKIYSDVDTKHWANGVISVGTTVPSDANGLAMLAGYPDGSFKPENDVTYAELAKMLVVLAKKDLTADMVKNAKWATSWMTWAAELGILDDVDYKDSNKAANRADAFTMIYNALYKMQEFKRVPANETRGIISSLTKDTLQLNQDSKMEYKVNPDTVFVTGRDLKGEQIVKLSDFNLKATDYYLGSLVRILTNDKNEVTHIIELGNPLYLAKGNEQAQVKVDNRVWTGVADNTVETAFYNEKTLKDVNYNKDYPSYVTIGLNSSRVDAKNITFHGVTGKGTANNAITLRVTDKTEIYVANPANNQMRKLSGIVEALSLIGYKNYQDGYRIPNVYAGFDVDGARDAHKDMILNGGRNTAKVIVFNVVSKDKGGDLYRVLNSPSSQFRDTLENTDGKLFDRNNFQDVSIFPLEYSAHLDVIEVYNFANGSNHEVKIDHSATDRFPIVEVTGIKEGKYLEVRDGSKHPNIAVLDIRDADIFSAVRFDKLTVGSKIQFRVENHGEKNRTNVAEIISILPRDTKLEGSLYGVTGSVDAREERGLILNVNEINGDHPTLVARVDNNVLNAADNSGKAAYNISKDNAARLQAQYELDKDAKIVFTVYDELGWAGKYYADNFRVEKDGKLVDLPKAKSTLAPYDELKSLIDSAVAKYGRDYENLKACADLEEANALLKRIDAQAKKLNITDNADYTKAGNAYKASRDAFEQKIQTVEAEKEAVKTEATRIAGIFKTKFAGEVKYEQTAAKEIAKELKTLLTTDAKPNNGFKAELVENSVKVKFVPENNGWVYGELKVTKGDCCMTVNFNFPITYKCPENTPAPKEPKCINEAGEYCVAPEANQAANCTTCNR